MVTIVSKLDDLEGLIGQRLPRDHEKLNELLYQVKCELSGTSRTEPVLDQSELQFENKDSNRPDTWSTEGIARALRGYMGIETGLKRYKLARTPAVEIQVEKVLKQIRPFIACVIARHVKLNDAAIRSLIQLQEKLDYSYGRRRRRSSIGFYDFDLITSPLRYGAVGQDDVSFVPLEGDKPMTLREILEVHPKGIEYGHIVKENPQNLPILLDAHQKVLSFPPIINSNDLGRITPDTRNVLVEITGTSEDTVMNVLTILTVTLADRGADVAPAVVHYNYGKARRVVTPNLEEKTMNVQTDDVMGVIGLELSRSQIASLLRRARYDSSASAGNRLKVRVPCYRMDILHPVDVLEDIAIAYGLNKVQPRWPSDLTIGSLSHMEEFSDTIRELMIGLGFQEILSFMMTNQDKLCTKMNRQADDLVEISNPKIATLTTLRSSLLPALLEFLARNTHVEYPQKVYEIGDCTSLDSTLPNRARDIRKLACASTHSKANFTEMKANLEPMMANLQLDFKLNPVENPTFLAGRVGSIIIGENEVGVVGEIHPQVIQNWTLEDPVSAMELDLDLLYQLKNS